MQKKPWFIVALVVWLSPFAGGCGGGSGSTGSSGGSRGTGGGPGTGGGLGTGGGSGTGGGTDAAQIAPGPNGNPNGHCAVPSAGLAADVSSPTTVVGTGSAASCTASAVVTAVAGGGVVTFNCGPDPVTITVPEIKIFNDGGLGDGSVTIDGGGLVTLSGDGANRILHQDTCDQSLHYTSTRCDLQTTPHMIVQNIGFANGSTPGDTTAFGGGAIYVSGGTFKAFNIRVTNSTQSTPHNDWAGGAIYTVQQTEPNFIVNSTFDGNVACNGGALGSIATSWSIYNSVFKNNHTLTTGGQGGGAIYNDGNSYTLSICGTDFEDNVAAAAVALGSGSIFQVVDDLKGKLVIDQSTFTGNSSNGSVQSSSHPSIYVQATDSAGNGGVTITATTFN